jgi:hypothetical protein
VKILVAGNIASGKSTIIHETLKSLKGWSYHAIDDYRAKYGDHTERGEDSARGAFIRDIVLANDCIVECSGVGKLYSLIKPQLDYMVLVKTSVPRCLQRYKERDSAVVMPKEWFKDWTIEGSVKYINQCHKVTPYDLTLGGISTGLSSRQLLRFIRNKGRCRK